MIKDQEHHNNVNERTHLLHEEKKRTSSDPNISHDYISPESAPYHPHNRPVSVPVRRGSHDRIEYFSTKTTESSLEALQEDLEKSHPTSEEESWEKFGRKTLYGSLPFMAAFGMQKKENAMKKVISAVSMSALAKLHLDKELMIEVSDICLVDVVRSVLISFFLYYICLSSRLFRSALSPLY
jgi:hypothetical protein